MYSLYLGCFFVIFSAKDFIIAVVVDTECFSIRCNYSANGEANALHVCSSNRMFSLTKAMITVMQKLTYERKYFEHALKYYYDVSKPSWLQYQTKIAIQNEYGYPFLTLVMMVSTCHRGVLAGNFE